MDYALNSIIGKRENQEDYGVIKNSGSSGGVLAVIADGMGGQVAGEVASSTAVNEFIESFTSNDSKNLPLKLNLALDKANRSLAKSIAKNPKFKGMGATLIAAQIEPRSIFWVSVGDSILYLFRAKKLYRLNEDHSMMPVIQESIRRGKITPEEARVHPHRNALRSALTGDEIPIVDLSDEQFALKKGDLIVLSTDGILTLSESEISSILDQYKDESAKVITSELLEAINQIDKPRQDNTLVEVIKVTGGSKVGFSWAHTVTAILIFVIAALLTFSVWEKRELISQYIGFETTNNSSEPKNPFPKVKPVQIEPPPLLGQTQPTSASAYSSDSSITVNNQKSSQDKKSPPANKTAKSGVPKDSLKDGESQKQFPLKVDPSSPGPTMSSTSTVRSIGSEPSVDAASTIAIPAKTGPVQKNDGDRAAQFLEGANLPKVNSDPDRKE